MKRLGKVKAEKLERKAPGITLSGWLKKNYTHVTLSERICDKGQTLVVPRHCVELTIGLLSTDNIKDWAHLAMHWAPAGTIIDKVPESTYDQSILLLRQLLTKRLLEEPDDRMAKRYMSILERRDPTRWAQNCGNKLSVKASVDSEQSAGANGDIKIEFEIVGNPPN